MALEIQVRYQRRLNWSLLRAGIPFVRSITVSNDGPEESVPLEIRLRLPGYVDSEPTPLIIAPVAAGTTRTVPLERMVYWKVDYERAVLLGYPFRSDLIVIVNGARLAFPVNVLMADEWLPGYGAHWNMAGSLDVGPARELEWAIGVGSLPLSDHYRVDHETETWTGDPPIEAAGAALVMPTHPAVERIRREALEEPVFTGAERAFEKLYEYLQRTFRGARHDIEKFGWERASQRIRFPHEILKGSRGPAATCIDYALLAAAVLEAGGYYPVLLLTARNNTAHAMLGCWTSRPEKPPPVIRRCGVILSAMDAQCTNPTEETPSLIAVDITVFASGKTWKEARSRAESTLRSDRFLYGLDVVACRDSWDVHPLPHDVAPPVFPGPAPGSDLDLGRSVVFSVRDSDGTDRRVTALDALNMWLSADGARPLVLAFDFVPDAQSTMRALFGSDILKDRTECSIEQVAPVDLAEALAALAGKYAGGRTQPTVLLLDLSSIIESAENGDAIWREVHSFWARLAPWRKYRIVIAVPRWLLPEPGHWLNTEPFVFTAAPLYSPLLPQRIGERIAELGERFELGSTLRTLLTANSPALISFAEQFFSERSVADIELEPRPEPQAISVVLRLAAALAGAGYFEVAFRLEEACIAACQADQSVALGVDIFEPGSHPDVVDHLTDPRWIPHVVRHGWLVSDPGSGKSRALARIRRHWIVPRFLAQGLERPAWFPLLVSAAGDPQPDPVACLERALLDRSHLEIAGQRFSLPCHSMLSDAVKRHGLRELRRLVSSPLYLLVDGLDDWNGVRLQAFVMKLQSADPQSAMGMLAAAGITPGHPGQTGRRFRVVRLRPLNRKSIAEVAEQRAGHAVSETVRAVYDRAGRQVREWMRHPQLLSWVCEMPAQTIRNSKPVDAVGRHVSTRVPDEDLKGWLAERAFEMRTSRQPFLECQPIWYDWIARARSAGILRHHAEPGRVIFASEIVGDYLAACQLGALIPGEDAAAILAPVQAGFRDWWQGCLSMLVCLAGPSLAHRLILSILDLDPFVAARCAAARWDGSEHDEEVIGLFREIVRGIERVRLEDRWKALDQIGRLDPRIRFEDAIVNLLPVEPPSVDSLRIGRYPVTTMEFSAFARDGYRYREFWTDAGWAWLMHINKRPPPRLARCLAEAPNHPVSDVSFYEADAYTRWLSRQHRHCSFFLPTAKEWDFAGMGAGAGHSTVLSDGLLGIRAELLRLALARHASSDIRHDGLQVDRLTGILDSIRKLLDNDPSFRRPPGIGSIPVGACEPNALGFHDLFGAHWEWCDSAPTSVDQLRPSHNPNAAAYAAAVKGGPSHANLDRVQMILGGYFDPQTRFEQIGFRVAARIGE
jgi:formylglycine-generating enzyme required for sulfatase activity